MLFSLQVAIRFLRSSKGQTLLIVMGIAVGVAVMIFIGALINGLQRSIIDATIGSSSQVSIYYEPEEKEKDKVFSGYKRILTKIESMDLGATAITPVLNRNGFGIFKNVTEPVAVKGIDLQTSGQLYKFKDKLVDGRMLLRKKEAMIGVNLAQKMNLSVDDSIIIRTSYGKDTEFIVVGTLDYGADALNDTSVVAELGDVQRAFDLKDEVSRIEMQFSDVFVADERAEMIESTLGDTQLSVINWKVENKSLLSALNSQSSSTYIIQICVLLSVLLGIASVLMISVVQKSKQIGILKAMGISNFNAGLIFMFQGGILGVLGSATGIIMAIALLKAFEKAALSGGRASFSVSFDLDYMIQISILSIISSLVASFVPTLKTKDVDPIDVIRNN